jgi:hypothetical protein
VSEVREPDVQAVSIQELTNHRIRPAWVAYPMTRVGLFLLG